MPRARSSSAVADQPCLLALPDTCVIFRSWHISSSFTMLLSWSVPTCLFPTHLVSRQPGADRAPRPFAYQHRRRPDRVRVRAPPKQGPSIRSTDCNRSRAVSSRRDRRRVREELARAGGRGDGDLPDGDGVSRLFRLFALRTRADSKLWAWAMQDRSAKQRTTRPGVIVRAVDSCFVLPYAWSVLASCCPLSFYETRLTLLLSLHWL